MKKIYPIILLIFTTLIFISCQKETEIPNNVDRSVLIENLKKEATIFKDKITTDKNSQITSNKTFNTITIDDVKGMLNSSIALIKSYDISEAEIIEEFGTLDNPGIVESALAIAQIENQADYGVELIDVETETSLLTGEPADLTHIDDLNRKNKDNISFKIKTDLYDCALQAVGITAIRDLINGGISQMGKGAAKKLLKKVASKYLGWVGLAYATYEFGDCMEWW